MKKLLLLVALAAALAGSAFADQLLWVGTLGGGDGSFMGANNWSPDYVTPDTIGAGDVARIATTDWMAGYPTLSGTAGIQGVYMGLQAGSANVATLNITATGNLLIDGDDGWNDGIQIGWYNDAVLTSAGSVNTMWGSVSHGGTELGMGDAGNGYGDATLNIDGGLYTTAFVNFNANSENHIQLDGGTMTTWALNNLHGANQTVDITGDGTIVLYTADTGWFDWMKDNNLGLTANGSTDDLVGNYADGAWTIGAVPEPATAMLLALGGGLAWLVRMKNIGY